MKTKDRAVELAPPLKLRHQILSRIGFLGVREVVDYSAQHPYRPRRAEETINATHTTARGARLEQPDPVLINMIEREEPKVKYLGVASTDDFRTSPMGFMTSRGYEHHVLKPLDAQIKKDFPNQTVLTRTTHVSINGSIRLRNMILIDAIDAAQQGEERGSLVFGTIQADTNESTPNTYYPFKDYVGELSELRRRLSREGRGEDVFHAVIVYDPEHTERNGYATRFTSAPEKAVLGLYILDAPLPTEHSSMVNTYN